ncbi:MAG: carboxypeptidase-like regulatory domain-containing protein, partial [Nitrososphaera sp.]|nr:carboxypeptidase-like regulatory domain-containing protein [Nitrososphaera sp.]
VWIFVLMLAVALVASAQETALQSAQEPETFTIEGTVIDANTGRPLSAVNIVVRGTRTGVSTDANGYFRLELPTEARHIVSITHVGYEKWTKDFLVLSQRELRWNVELTSQPVGMSEVRVTAERPFGHKRARYILNAEDFEKTGEPDLERTLRYLLPNVIVPWDVRYRTPNKDFTLYLDGEWLESFELVDIDPYSVRQVLVWDGQFSPVGFPVRRGKFVVSIITENHPQENL